MSAVDWGQAPEGAVAYVTNDSILGFRNKWIIAERLGAIVHIGLQPAPSFGMSVSVTIRPSVAEAELRAEVERLKSMYDDALETAGRALTQKEVLQNRMVDIDALTAERDQLRAELERLRGEVALFESRSDELMIGAAQVTAERDQLRAENTALIEQCAKACEAEAVDSEATGEDGDHAYNAALEHAAAAIRALNAKGPF